MKIYQTGSYQVRKESVETVKAAIREFVAYVEENEPGTELSFSRVRRCREGIFTQGRMERIPESLEGYRTVISTSGPSFSYHLLA